MKHMDASYPRYKKQKPTSATSNQDLSNWIYNHANVIAHSAFIIDNPKILHRACQLVSSARANKPNAAYSLISPFINSQFDSQAKNSDILSSVRIGRSLYSRNYEILNIVNDFSHPVYIEEQLNTLYLLTKKTLPAQYEKILNPNTLSAFYNLGKYVASSYKAHINHQYNANYINCQSDILRHYKQISNFWCSLNKKVKHSIIKGCIDKYLAEHTGCLNDEECRQMMLAFISTCVEQATNFISFVYFPPIVYHGTHILELCDIILASITHYIDCPTPIKVSNIAVAKLFTSKEPLNMHTIWFIQEHFQNTTYFKAKHEHTQYNSNIEESVSTYEDSDVEVDQSKIKEVEKEAEPKASPKESLLTNCIDHTINDKQINEFISKLSSVNAIIDRARMRAVAMIGHAYSQMHNNIYNIQPIIYGSVPCNLSTESSDIDVGLIGCPARDSDGYIEEYKALEAYCKTLSSVTEAIAILNANVPVLKVKINDFSGNEIRMDILLSESFASICPVMRGVYSRELIKQCLTKYMNSREIILCLKKLLKAQSLNIPYKGGLSSYALVILVITFLKMSPSSSTSKSIVDFLNYYGRFDASKKAISAQFEVFHKSEESPYIVVMDPVIPNQNITQSAYMFSKVQECFLDAHEKLLRGENISVLLDIK